MAVWDEVGTFFTEMLESVQKRRIGCNILKNALPARVANG
jgi:hypothetical protein